MNFYIRDLLLVTVIVALGVGWWLYHRRQAAEIRSLKAPGREMREVARRINAAIRRSEALTNSSAPAPNPPEE